MISVKINNLEFSVKPGISILEACKYVGITVPRFCYHELLSVSGNCRMCLVEVEPFEKPVASCVAEIEDNMSIRIDTPFVKKARENVMELLLLNHPLDCPICDQAGECDLQDQAKTFGSNFSRTFFNRKAVEDKYCGPLIKTIMTRCISCTRCVRFGSEIAGVDFFGTLNRGGSTEIGNYVQKMFMSEISGNVIDLCPVGALTSKPYAFKSRPWELRVIESIDTTDSLGSNVYVNFKETEVSRILPKNNVNLNLSLLSDKARFSYDALNRNRIDNLYKYNSVTNQYNKVKWISFFKEVDSFLDKSEGKMSLVINDEIDLESALYLKYITYSKKLNVKTFITSLSDNKDNLYISPLKSIKDLIDNANRFVLLVGTNLRSENAMLNTRLKIETNKRFLEVCITGSNYKSNLPSVCLHFSITNLMSLFEAKKEKVSKYFINAKNSLVVFGSSFRLRIKSCNSLFFSIQNTNLNIDILNLQNFCNSDGLNYINLKSSNTINKKASIFGLNISDDYTSRLLFTKQKKNKSVWINTHGSFVSTNSTYILPSKSNFEQEVTFLNQEHIPQHTNSSISGPSHSRSLSQIIKSIIGNNYKVSYFDHLLEQSKTKIYSNSFKSLHYKNLFQKKITDFFRTSLISTYPIKILQKEHYISNNFLRNSENMFLCSKEFKDLSSNF